MTEERLEATGAAAELVHAGRAGEPDLASVARSVADRIRAGAPLEPRVMLILGSGLGAIADDFEDATRIPFSEIPEFPPVTVEGHAGALVIGRLEGVPCVALQGRFHLYEGHDAALAAFPVRVMAALGARALLVTNAAGGVHPDFNAGDLMLIEDHINLTGRNPLVGPVVEGDRRFPDMTEPYDPVFKQAALEVAEREGIRLGRGVYCAVLGPSYETSAEIRMLTKLGADAVGMSTVHEVITARASGIRVLGISLISNLAAGLSPEPLHHEEVVAAGAEARPRFERLVRGAVRAIDAAL
ncbi:MAG TPA: purine-nucleoside phosphorylase [Longimicrobiales bacterium]|nr:purine-nucleoside phosphorylase [Longimicrobiales bacterium]